MAKKWEKMTKNQKLDMLRAEVAKIMTAVSKLTRRFDGVERNKSKKPKAKRKTKAMKVSEGTVPPPTDPTLAAALSTDISSAAQPRVTFNDPEAIKPLEAANT